MISDEQNQYEYGMENRYLSFIGAIAEDGLEWGKNPRPPFMEGREKWRIPLWYIRNCNR